MWVKRTIVPAAILVMALAAPAAAGMMMGQMPPGGQPDGMGGGRMERGMHGGRMASHEGPLLSMMLHHGQELGLTPEQEQKLRGLRTEFSKETVRRSAEIRVAQIELNSLLEQNQWDVAQLGTFRQIGHRMRSMGEPGGMGQRMMGPGSPSGSGGQTPTAPPTQQHTH